MLARCSTTTTCSAAARRQPSADLAKDKPPAANGRASKINPREPGEGVVVSKTELAERMVELIFDDIRERGAEAVGEGRPIVRMLIAIVRVT